MNEPARIAETGGRVQKKHEWTGDAHGSEGERPYRVYFVSHDRGEPPHVYVDRDDSTAKFWLSPVALAHNIGFRAKELRDIQRLVAEHAAEWLEVWNDNFGTEAG